VEVLAKEGIKLRVIRGAVFRPKPPAPVAALRGEQGLPALPPVPRQSRGRPALGAGFEGVGTSLAGHPRADPKRWVFQVADPHVKIALIQEAGKMPPVVGTSLAAAMVSLAVRARKSWSSLMRR